MNYKKGFTLIELLVVISIIALLSSVVLSSLNTARTKAADNAVKAAMKQIGSHAEIYRDSVANFSGSVPVDSTPTCTEGVFNDPKIVLSKTNILSNAATGATFTCYWDTSSGSKWAISISALRGGGTWCVDNSSWFKAGTAQSTGVCS